MSLRSGTSGLDSVDVEKVNRSVSPLHRNSTSGFSGPAHPSFNFNAPASAQGFSYHRTDSPGGFNFNRTDSPGFARTQSPSVRLSTSSAGERITGNLLRAKSTPHVAPSANSTSPSSSTSIEYSNPPQSWQRPSEDDTPRYQPRRHTFVELPADPTAGRIPSLSQRSSKPDFLKGPPPPPPPAVPPMPTAPSKARYSQQSSKSHEVHEMKQAPFQMRSDSQMQTESMRSLVPTIREKSSFIDGPSTFAQRVFEAGKPDLLYDLRTTILLKDHKDGFLDLTTLQRMSTHVLQQKLVEQVKAIGDRGAWMEIGIKDALHDYCEAIRDLQFMESCGTNGKDNDPFLLSTVKPMDCQLLEDAGLAWRDSKHKPARQHPDRLEYTKRVSPVRQRLRRLLMALLGGLALIAPFLIITLLQGQLVRLVVTCGFMVVFAIAAAIGSELSPDRVALATAAYAAALVIFVGNNPPTWQY
ncbi:hypothetical protein BAUCODRAFT_34555 [Baudoinia panamericana UAMH 10762]|uniref:DUF6594 domain-containing protein n=1 Tax=Baudoinia panamericana (strain UAMH 10762) TaxID=717646 RepID=M2N9J5_BAUPA|nr:uncharacterized protein BAUCODRAFT_34555 [Baudoinia panamericana UAMH 10762]EMC95789.1 hypothetical protein BAUCODRAFT_34555 [Baudoinia panamericana UAMH 10762]